MKARLRYRIYPNRPQRLMLAKTFGYARIVYPVKPNSVYLAKISCVRVKWSRDLPSDPSSVTIIKDAANRYFASNVLCLGFTSRLIS